MSAEVLLAQVTEDVLSIAEHEALVAHDGAGAVVSFAGIVRDHDGGRGVQALDYSAHPTAAALVAEVAADVAARSVGVRRVAVSHRVGPLAVGDVALACAVSADHRGAAFTACALLVDEVKARIQVWKRQVFADGTEEWVGSA
ncbi:MAG: molybdenum cofactor biosynthesis protein MoaE [Mycobacteriaceae bacterium]